MMQHSPAAHNDYTVVVFNIERQITRSDINNHIQVSTRATLATLSISYIPTILGDM